MKSPAIIDSLKDIEFFAGLEEADLLAALEDSYEQSFLKDDYLFYQDDAAKVFYVLVEGHIKLTQLTPEGNQVIMHYVSPGEAFAIVAVLREIDYPVTAQAIEDSMVLAWDDRAMKQLMYRHPRIALNSIKILSKFILDFQSRIRELSTERVERRIARALLRLAQQTGRKVEAGVTIDLKLTRQDIAEMTGTTLYTVSRTLSKWETQEIIESGTEVIVIKTPHDLVNIAEDLPA